MARMQRSRPTPLFYRHGAPNLYPNTRISRRDPLNEDLRGFDRLVAEPQCDHRTIDPRLEQRHGGGMSENMRCDALVLE